MAKNKEINLFMLTNNEINILREFNCGIHYTVESLAEYELFLANINDSRSVKVGNINRIVNILVDHKLLAFNAVLTARNKASKEYFITDRGIKYLHIYDVYHTAIDNLFPNRLEVTA